MDMNTDYRNYQIKAEGCGDENITWTKSRHFPCKKENSPRLLAIGDSICDAYEGQLLPLINNEAGLSYWASSRCITNKYYIRELELVLDVKKYDYILFNNGLHSRGADLEQWNEAYSLAVDFIHAKQPWVKMAVVTSTPYEDDKKNEFVRKINEITKEIAGAKGVPVLDLFRITCDTPLENRWSDGVHFQPETVKLQAKAIRAFISETFGV